MGYYVGDEGTVILVDTEIDLTGSTSYQFEVKKSDDSTVQWPATIPAGMGEADGFLTYTTIAGDLDQAGIYKLQARVIGSNTNHLGDTVNITIREEFE